MIKLFKSLIKAMWFIAKAVWFCIVLILIGALVKDYAGEWIKKYKKRKEHQEKVEEMLENA